MFNGIIYNQGTVTKIIKRPKGLNIFIKSNLRLKALKAGGALLFRLHKAGMNIFKFNSSSLNGRNVSVIKKSNRLI